MTAQRGRAALLRSTAVLLAVSLAMPAGARAGQGTHRTHRVAAAPGPDAVAPGDDARAALSRLVVEPGVVLKAYAPTHGADAMLPGPETCRARMRLLRTGPIPP